MYYTFQRKKADYCDIKDIIYTYCGTLFPYQFSHAWIDFKNLTPIYPGFIKYLDTSLYFTNEGECLIKFQIPFTHKKYD